MSVCCAYPVNHSLDFMSKSQALGPDSVANCSSVWIMLLDSKKYGNLRCLINSDIERSSWQHNSNYESFDSSNVHAKCV